MGRRGVLVGVLLLALVPSLAAPAVVARAVATVAAPVAVRVTPSSGLTAGGTLVTIRGRHLEGVRRVWFGQDRARGVRVLGSHRLLVRAPARRAGRVAVWVLAHGVRSRLTHFTYIDPPPPPPVAAPAVAAVTPGTGWSGDTVTIVGSGFDGLTAVAFGGVEAAWTAHSSTQVTVVAPPHAEGVVGVTVTTAAGSSAAGPAATFHYVSPDLGPPIVQTIYPSYGPVAGGTAVHIVGSNLGHATQVLFGGVPAAYVVGADGSVDAVSPPHAAGGALVQVVNSRGTSVPGSNQITYFAYESPQPRVTQVEPYRGPPAGGTRVTVTGTGLAGATSVAFGGVAGIDLVVLSDTALQVTAPAHAVAAVDVIVTNAQHSSFPHGWQSSFTYYHDANIQVAPLPGNADEEPDMYLNDVACPATGSCVAVGQYQAVVDARDTSRGLVETLDAGEWRPLTLPPPGEHGENGYFGVFVVDVDCPSTATCVAVGTYGARFVIGDDPVDRPLVYRRDNGVWSWVPIPVGGGEDTSVRLDKLDCTSATSCVALGEECHDGCAPAAWVMSGTTWTHTRIPLADGLPYLGLDDLDCWAANGCLAVGATSTPVVGAPGYHGIPAIARYDGHRWTTTLGTRPADAADDGGFLASISCSLEGCHALGGYTLATGDRQAYVSTLTFPGTGTGSGIEEATVRLPLPADAIADARILTMTLECPAFDWCEGLANYRYTDDDYRTLDATIQPGLITVERVPSPPGSPYQDYLSDVACVAAADCLGVGSQHYTELGRPSTSTELAATPAPGYAPGTYGFSMTRVVADSATTAVAIGHGGNSTNLGVLVTALPMPTAGQ